VLSVALKEKRDGIFYELKWHLPFQAWLSIGTNRHISWTSLIAIGLGRTNA